MKVFPVTRRRVLAFASIALLFFDSSRALADPGHCKADGLFVRRYDDSEMMLSLHEERGLIQGRFLAYSWVSDVDARFSSVQETHAVGSHVGETISLFVGDPITQSITHRIRGKIMCRETTANRGQVDLLFLGRGLERDVWFVRVGDTADILDEVKSLKVYLYGSDLQFEAIVQGRIRREPALRRRLEARRRAAIARPAAVLESISAKTAK